MSMDRLIEGIKKTGNPTVAGLDPKIEYVPKFIRERNYDEYGKNLKGVCEAILAYNKGLIDALCDVVPAVKPQSAYYEMYGIGGLITLEHTISYAKKKGLYVILDVKRNDIGTTAEAYSHAFLGQTDLDGYSERLSETDSITVNPYLGTDGIKPFVSDCVKYDKSIFVLVKTSNPSSGEIQDLLVDGQAIYEKVGSLVKDWGDGTGGKHGYNAVGAVVGATYPAQAQVLREMMPNTYFLVPGYGAQGATVKDVANSFNKDGLGAIVNSSRGIMCAYQKGSWTPEAYAEAARAEAIRMRDELVAHIK